ncbi:hypothetical protein [Bdellovibrio bacteriovorus]|uniref:hypothetical protein n=1 Tax=Bdellovibrio bacteriovorus TaxID=959 RepID=UPI0035A735F6
MKARLVALLLILSFQPAWAGTPLDIVFDIDWTTFYTVHSEDPNERSSKSIQIEGKTYRPTDHLTEVIEHLLKTHPDIRISFFSGGTQSRNMTLLESVKLSDGRSLVDISHRILSYEDLTVVSQNKTLKFSEQHKKVLNQGIPDWNPKNTLLIDDQPEFAVKPLKSVSSLGHFNFQQKFDVSRAGEKFFPASEIEWKMERNKALVWLALLENAIAESARTGKDFSTVAQELWTRDSKNPFILKQGQDLLPSLKGQACRKIFAL